VIPEFRHSSHCKAGTCVEVAATADTVLVRDSTGTVLEFTPAEWDEFLKGVRAGEFDL